MTRVRVLLAAFLLLGCLEKGAGPGDGDSPGPEDTYRDTVRYSAQPVSIGNRFLPPMPVPESNPLTDEGILLGRMLFFDRKLSQDSSVSCATCHAPEHSFSDAGKATSAGIHGRRGSLNTPALINLAWSKALFWNGRSPSLEDQARFPIMEPGEMGLPFGELAERFKGDAAYRDQFKRAFGYAYVDSGGVVKALAQYQRSLVSMDSRYDRWKRGDLEFTDQEYRGFVLYTTEKADCFHCHPPPFFTDHGFRNNGLDSSIQGTGLGAANGNPHDFGKWKTPTLRNLGSTAPYMHDGRFSTLEEVVEFYDAGGHFSATLDPLIRNSGTSDPSRNGLKLSAQDKADLLAFLATLDDSSFIAKHSSRSP